MANRANFKFNREELAKLVSSYIALGDFLQEVVGPEQLYSGSFVKGMKEAISDYKKGHVKRVRTIYDLTA